MGGAALSGQDIICFAFEPWHAPWKTDQQIMSLFAESNRVLYVGPPRTLREAIAGFRARTRRSPIIERMGENLYLYHEPRFLVRARVNRPFSRPFNWITERLRLQHIRWVAWHLGFRAPILWVMDPMLASVVGMFHEKLLVYHVIDTYLEYLPPGHVAGRAAVLRNEERMLEAAECVFAVSQPLYERCLKTNPNSFLVPNAVNYELFQGAMTNGKVPPDVRAIPRPIIGYVGEIQTMFQFALLDQVAAERPEWSLMLVGPLDLGEDRSNLDALLTWPNVYYLGGRSVQEVPDYVKSCDVCIMTDDERTDGDSIKLYEYLACGRPVVSTDPSVRRYGSLVKVARDSYEFVRCVEECLNEGPERLEARMAFARGHSWRCRVEVMSEAIRRSLSSGRASRHLRPMSHIPGGAPW